MDFCLYGPDERGDGACYDRDGAKVECAHEQYYQADVYAWHREIDSFWCAGDLALYLCAHLVWDQTTNSYRRVLGAPDVGRDGLCHPDKGNLFIGHDKHSTLAMEITSKVLWDGTGAPVAVAADASLDIKMNSDSIWVVRPLCPPGFAWLFEGEDCDFAGELRPLWISPYARQADPSDPTGSGLSDFTRDWEGSWDYYHTLRNAPAANKSSETREATSLLSGKIKSALVCPLTEVEFFRGSDSLQITDDYHWDSFESNSFTIRAPHDSRMPGTPTDMTQAARWAWRACLKVPRLAPWLSQKGLDTDPDAGMTGVFAVKTRPLSVPDDVEWDYRAPFWPFVAQAEGTP